MNFIERIELLRAFAESYDDKRFNNTFIEAYLKETAFTYQDIVRREVEVPQKLIRLFVSMAEGKHAKEWEERHSLGSVAILLPKNGIGLTAAKSLSSSFLVGNQTIVKLPSQLAESRVIYEQFVTRHLPNVSFESKLSSREFLRKCFTDPEIKAIVIYGDDSWISQYKPLAMSTGTKLIFEGPGKDPQIIYPGSDMDRVVRDAIACGLVNGGQSCSAFERFFVHQQVHDEFVNQLTEAVSTIRGGHPRDLDVKVGPTKSSKALKRIEQQVAEAVEQGAQRLIGGRIRPSGYRDLSYFEPTILTHCHTNMRVMREETFGPVFPIVSFNGDKEQLIEQLDTSHYGLNASVYGQYPASVGDHLKATHRNAFGNSCFVNPENTASKLVDGGYQQSAFIWETVNGEFNIRHGKRQLATELSYSLSLEEIHEHYD